MQVKCAGIILRQGELLVTRKKGTDVFISPGGKLEADEDYEACLIRELKEELDVKVTDIKLFGEFIKDSAIESGKIKIVVFHTKVSGTCQPAGEIEELKWVNATNYSFTNIGSVFKAEVIPRLIQSGYMYS